MKILLVDGYDQLKFLTKSLKIRGHDITIINEDSKWCRVLSDTYEVISVHGDGTNSDILRQADASRMDIVVALNNKDASNLITCEIAKKEFNVKNTIAVVNDPDNIRLFEKFGVNKCVSSTQMVNNIIDQTSIVENIQNYLPLENGRVFISEIKLDKNSPVIGKKLWEISFPKESTVGCIIRGEQIIIPQGNIKLEVEDKVIVISIPEVVENINSLFINRKSKWGNATDKIKNVFIKPKE